MITKIHNANDVMEAFAENFEMVVEGKRSLRVANAVQKNLSGMVSLAKVQVLEKLRVNDKTPLLWLWVDEQKRVENKEDESTSE